MHRVEVITVDNASYMTVAVEVSGANLKLGCFAHTLNLASNKALGMSSLDKLLDKCVQLFPNFPKAILLQNFQRKSWWPFNCRNTS